MKIRAAGVSIALALSAMIGAALPASTAAQAATPASANYALPASVINNGVDTMSSASYVLSSSIGDGVATARLTSTGSVLSSGFWHSVIGVTQGCVLDIDGNQSISATTDGLMLLRAMLGLTGTAVTQGATVPGARTTWEQIAPFVRLAALNLDGTGNTTASTDGVLLLRAMFGLTGTAVTNDITLAPGRTWADVRTYLNTHCGGSFSL